MQWESFVECFVVNVRIWNVQDLWSSSGGGSNDDGVVVYDAPRKYGNGCNVGWGQCNHIANIFWFTMNRWADNRENLGKITSKELNEKCNVTNGCWMKWKYSWKNNSENNDDVDVGGWEKCGLNVFDFVETRVCLIHIIRSKQTHNQRQSKRQKSKAERLIKKRGDNNSNKHFVECYN